MEKRILIDLDVVLDTRLGLISMIQPELEERVASSKEYRIRKFDSFDWVKGLDSEKLKKAWVERTSEVLPYSKMTLFTAIELTNHLLEWDEVIIGNSPKVSKISILINMFPYDLTEDIQNKICFAIAMRAGISNPDDVKPVFWETESLILSEMEKNSIVSYFPYNLDSWISSNYPDDENVDYEKAGLTRYPELSVTAPKMYASMTDVKEVLAEVHPDLGKADPFDATARCFAPCFQLGFLPSPVYTRMDKYSLEILESRAKENKMKRLSDAEIVIAIDRMFNHEEDVHIVVEKRLDFLEVELSALREAFATKDLDKARHSLVQVRHWMNTLGNLIPGSHTQDFWKYVDSVESYFDLDEQSAKETVIYWADKGAKTSTIVKQVNRESIYVCVLLEPFDGKAVGDVMPSKLYRKPEYDAVFIEGDSLWDKQPT